MPSPLGRMVLDIRPRTLTINASRELSGDRPMRILLGSKIHLFYNCPPDVFIDPRIQGAGGGGEAAQSVRGQPPPPPPLCNHGRKVRETIHSE